MSATFDNTHVSYLAKTKRRRSQSVTIPNSDQQDTPGQSNRRKQFWAELQMEREKQQHGSDEHSERQQENDKDHDQPIVTRIPGAKTSASVKKHISPTKSKSRATDENDQYQPIVTRIAEGTTTLSRKKEIASTVFKTTYTEKDEEYDDHQFQIDRKPRLESTRSLKGQLSTTPSNDLDSDLLQSAYNPYTTSTTNILATSDIFDQEFNLNDGKNRTRKNDVKEPGNGKKSDREKYYVIDGKKLPTKSSASFLAGLIGIITGVIAFALALAAFVLVLLLRANIAASSATNSTTSSGGTGILPSSCSAYTTLNDPTRNVYAAGYALGCDNTAPFINLTLPIWIRFTGTGGTKLPLSTPGMNLCGSEGTGWYDGTMPSSTGEITNGTACFSWYTSVCRFSVSIRVANCGSFYIYLLPPAPACMMRYCTI